MNKYITEATKGSLKIYTNSILDTKHRDTYTNLSQHIALTKFTYRFSYVPLLCSDFLAMLGWIKVYEILLQSDSKWMNGYQ